MPLYSWESLEPKLGSGVWIAPNAQVIGNVSIGNDANIWFGCLVRGDVEAIIIGKDSNIQDLSVLHTTSGKSPLVIGEACTLGHQSTVHGCTLHNHAFVGIGAIVLDDCELGEFSILAAGSLLPANKKIPPHTVAMGRPAKVIREITKEEEQMIRSTPLHYKQLKEKYRDQTSFKLQET